MALPRLNCCMDDVMLKSICKIFPKCDSKQLK